MSPEELSAWRKSERKQRIAAREAVPAEQRGQWRERMDRHVLGQFPELARGVLAFCWPYRGEYDSRHVVAQFRRLGAVAALPVVVAPRTPLAFREWHPGARMAIGALGIPFPEDTPEVLPDHVLLPTVGWDGAGYRLGYGGGFFDRTLASLAKHPLVIGTGYESQYLETIHPQPHDIPLDFVLTERGVYRRDADGLRFLDRTEGYSSPVCYAADIDPGYFGEGGTDK